MDSTNRTWNAGWPVRFHLALVRPSAPRCTQVYLAVGGNEGIEALEVLDPVFCNFHVLRTIVVVWQVWQYLDVRHLLLDNCLHETFQSFLGVVEARLALRIKNLVIFRQIGLHEFALKSAGVNILGSYEGVLSARRFNVKRDNRNASLFSLFNTTCDALL